MVRKGKKVLDQKLVREKTFILKIDGNISTEEKKKLELQDPTILCEKDCIFFKNEKKMCIRDRPRRVVAVYRWG